MDSPYGLHEVAGLIVYSSLTNSLAIAMKLIEAGCYTSGINIILRPTFVQLAKVCKPT